MVTCPACARAREGRGYTSAIAGRIDGRGGSDALRHGSHQDASRRRGRHVHAEVEEIYRVGQKRWEGLVESCKLGSGGSEDFQTLAAIAVGVGRGSHGLRHGGGGAGVETGGRQIGYGPADPRKCNRVGEVWCRACRADRDSRKLRDRVQRGLDDRSASAGERDWGRSPHNAVGVGPLDNIGSGRGAVAAGNRQKLDTGRGDFDRGSWRADCQNPIVRQVDLAVGLKLAISQQAVGWVGECDSGAVQAASLGPSGITRLVRDIRLVEMSLGDGVKKVFEREKPIIKKLRRIGGKL